MTRTSFEVLPVDGPRDPRSISRIVNQAMSGKQNSVIDFTIPAGGLPFTLVNPLFSTQSFVHLMPLNVAAADSVIYSTPGKGQCIFDESAEVEREAIAQVSQALGSVALVPAPGHTVIPFTTEEFNINWRLPSDPGGQANRIISKIAGHVTVSFIFNGVVSGNNRTIDIGYAHYDALGALQNRALIQAQTSGNVNTFNMSGYLIDPVFVGVGHYFQAEGVCSPSDTVSPYNFVMSVDHVTGLRGAVDNAPLEYRCLVIG